MISEAEITAAQKTLVTEAVGVFDTYDDLFETVKELGTEGFGRHHFAEFAARLHGRHTGASVLRRPRRPQFFRRIVERIVRRRIG